MQKKKTLINHGSVKFVSGLLCRDRIHKFTEKGPGSRVNGMKT